MKVVIFCGGYGTRMWPASRKSFPKQFYPLIDGKSFFEATYERFRHVLTPADILISTEKIYSPIVKKLKKEIPNQNIIAEPERRDNLAAVGLIATVCQKRYPGEAVFVSWSDHFIDKVNIFLKGAKVACDYAQETGKVVSLNEKPKSPSTNNEWVETGNTIDHFKGFDIFAIEKLIKRPELETAKKMFRSDKYLINTGYRAWRNDVILNYYQKFTPEIYQGLMKISDALGTKSEESVLYREYHKFPKDSVEFAIFEKMDRNVSVTIPLEFGWRDAGTWELLFNALRTKNDENVIETEYHELLESKNNLIVGMPGKMISLIGIKDTAVIDTKNGLLVVRIKDSAKVKELFAILEKKTPEFVE